MNRYQRQRFREIRRAAGSALVAVNGGDELEKQVQHDVVKLYQAMGCDVYSLSQPRATMQTPGLGDLFVVCWRKRLAWWHESKRRVDGKLTKQSDEQAEFQEKMDVCGIPYVLGGYQEAYDFLRSIGVIWADG